MPASQRTCLELRPNVSTKKLVLAPRKSPCQKFTQNTAAARSNRGRVHVPLFRNRLIIQLLPVEVCSDHSSMTIMHMLAPVIIYH